MNRRKVLPAGLVACSLVLAVVSCEDTRSTAPTSDSMRVIATSVADIREEDAADVLFGPKRFQRERGEPVTERIVVTGPEFESFERPFRLHIENGAGDGSRRVSSARIWLDGKQIFGPNDFRLSPSLLTTIVDLRAGSVLSVQLASAPGSYLTVQITGKRVSAQALIGSGGGAVTFPSVASFVLPRSFLPNAQAVEVRRIQEAAVLNKFTEFEGLFRVGNKTNYQIRLLIGKTPPTGSGFDAIVSVPPSISISAGHRPELFVQEYETGGQEVLDNFQLHISAWDPRTRILTAALPRRVLTNARRADGRYEALLIVATTPGGVQTSSQPARALALGTQATCLAAPIRHPLAGNPAVTSPYGPRTHPIAGMHWGTDFGVPSLTTVSAVADGTIERIRINNGGLSAGYGLYLILRHHDLSATLYAHLDNTSGVIEGDSVNAGDKIAESDNTGSSTGPHLHLDYVPNGTVFTKQRIDPVPCITSGQPLTGSLHLSAAGALPSGAALSATVTGPGGFAQAVHLTSGGAAATLANLQPGSYAITWPTVKAPLGFDFLFGVLPATTTVTVSPGQTASITGQFVPLTSVLSLTVSGIPDGEHVDATVTGPGGFQQTVSVIFLQSNPNFATSFSLLTPGQYTVRWHQYKSCPGTPPPASIQVAASLTPAVVQGMYSLGSCVPGTPPTWQISQIVAGRFHACALDAAQIAYCWGTNDDGQLGDGSNVTRLTPTPVLTQLRFTELRAGSVHTCGKARTGGWHCWGNNLFGQLGDGSTVNWLSPVPVAGGIAYSNVSTGGGHTCAHTTQGALDCWGLNTHGQLATNDFLNRQLPTQVSQLTASYVSAGAAHTCALDTQGRAFCWGSGRSGVRGDGTGGGNISTSVPFPVPVIGGLSFTRLSAGDLHNCAVSATGSAYCWGDDIWGQLGIGSSHWQPGPQPVTGGLIFASVAAGGRHNCGLTSAVGNLYCWGAGLGTGTSGNSLRAPTLVAPGKTFLHVATGADFTCAIDQFSVAVCWGFNAYGALGDGTTVDRSTPAPVKHP